MRKTNWIYFPKSANPSEFIRSVVTVFESEESHLVENSKDLDSNSVLAVIRQKLQAIGFQVEEGKRASEKIRVPVLFGRNGAVEKSFEADAWHHKERTVLEVESGRGYANNQFLKDLFQACMMHEVSYCCIAVRNKYRDSKDFEQVVSFFETLYASDRLRLPLSGVLVIGYGDTKTE